MRDRFQHHWGHLGTAFVLALVAGSLSGIVAAVLTNQSIDRYVQQLAEEAQLFSLSEVKPRPLPGSYEEALDRVQEGAAPATATFHLASEDSDQPDAWLRHGSGLGSGVAVTSDGWVLVHADVFEGIDDPAEALEVWIQKKRYSILEIVTDDLTSAAMVQIDGRDLPSVAFGATDRTDGGEIVFVNLAEEQVVATAIQDSQVAVSEALLAPAEEFLTGWQLTVSPERPSAVFNSASELIALSGEQAVPMHHMLGFVEATLRGQQNARAALGMYVVDIGSVANLDPELVGEVEEGALIIAPDRRTDAVLSGSPAEEAGLEAFDIVLAVSGEAIGSGQTLAEILAGYAVDDSVVLTYLRDGEEVEVTVSLSAYRDQRYP